MWRMRPVAGPHPFALWQPFPSSSHMLRVRVSLLLLSNLNHVKEKRIKKWQKSLVIHSAATKKRWSKGEDHSLTSEGAKLIDSIVFFNGKRSDIFTVSLVCHFAGRSENWGQIQEAGEERRRADNELQQKEEEAAQNGSMTWDHLFTHMIQNRETLLSLHSVQKRIFVFSFWLIVVPHVCLTKH